MSIEALTDAWENSPYTLGALHVHLVIANLVNDQHANQFWMSRAKTAAKARVSISTVDTALHRMIEDGWLTLVAEGGGRGVTSKYQYHFRGAGKTDQILDPFAETPQNLVETPQNPESRPLIENNESKRARTSRPAARGAPAPGGGAPVGRPNRVADAAEIRERDRRIAEEAVPMPAGLRDHFRPKTEGG